MSKNYIVPLTLTTVDGAAIAIDTWTAFSAAGLAQACFFIRVNNDSDTDIFLSFDGVNRHEFIAAGDKFDLNIQTNSSPSGYVSMLKKGSSISVQGVAAQAGDIYLSGYYNAK